MDRDDPVAAYRQFIEEFANKIDGLSPEDCEAPFRLSTFYLVPSEVEGECLEWTRRYLAQHDCPTGLVSQLSRAVYKHVKSSINISDFYAEGGDKGSSDDDGDDDDEKDNDDENCDNQSQGSQDLNSSKPPQLYASKLLQEVVCHIHTVVKEWSVSMPELHTPPTSVHVCSHAIKNTRRKMEDRHVTLMDINTLFELKDAPCQSYFAVFDGHGGLEAADYAATHLHLHLVHDEQFTVDPASAMKQAYKATDTRFLEKASRESLRSGTTGVSVLIRDSNLYVGWLGDSQALLVRAGQPVQIMNPHKPEREDERRRIEELGGCVLFFGAWRVNGNISVSRAIGDAPHKPFISSDADVTSIKMTGEEEYLVLACDGLWDVLSPAQVTRTVYMHSHSSPGGLDDVAIGLVNAARDAGSSDNISVVVVLFKSSLSVPQAMPDSDVMLGLKEISEKSLDQLSTSSALNYPMPPPPALNEKIRSKGKGDGQEKKNKKDVESSSISNHSIISPAHLSSSKIFTDKILTSPFSRELMRQAIFYISRNSSPHKDPQLAELAIRRAMSGEKARRKQKVASAASHRAKNGAVGNYTIVGSVRQPTIVGASQRSRVTARKGRKKTVRRVGKKPYSGETMWGLSSDSEDEWMVKNSRYNYQSYLRENSGLSTHSSRQPSMQKKLNPLNMKGSVLTSAAIAEASKWTNEKNLAPVMELSGMSLNLSHRSALPHIMAGSKTARDIWASSFTNSNRAILDSARKPPTSSSTSLALDGVITHRPRLARAFSGLSDTGLVHTSRSSRLETMSEYGGSTRRRKNSFRGGNRK